MKNNTYCIIMAGGIGSRFWPLSKSSTPKQFLDILGMGKSLIRQTYERFLPVCPKENFLVVTNSEYKNLVLKEIPELTETQVLQEPFRRNTAPCIAYANAFIRTREKNANIIVTPADHLIINEDAFIQSIEQGIEFTTKKEALLTLGIKPHRPETGYGYIQIGKSEAKTPAFKKVKTFTEKPNTELAKVFFESGEFFWNSGIFIWTLTDIDQAFEKHLPDIQQLFKNLDDKIGSDIEQETLTQTYTECKNISIDYGIMEKAENVYVQTVNFGWSDLGTWSSLYEYSAQDINDNAVINGKVLLYDTKKSIVNVPKDKIAIIKGLENYIVVDSGAELLICPKDNEQQIKQFTTDIKAEYGDLHL